MKENYEQILQQNHTLITERLRLRPFHDTDVDDVFLYASDAETVKYLTFEAHQTKEQSFYAIRNYYNRPGVYAITLKDSNKCIGCIDVRLNPEHDKASFGYVLNRNYWNQGYMTEALKSVLKLCFAQLDLNRVESTHYVGNEGSGMVMKKCGMQQEGIGKQEVLIKGKFVDVVHYAILREEWKKLAD